MLVCSISMRAPRRAIMADLAEAAAAEDASTTGTVIFATLVDDPAAVLDLIDAYLGEIMLEAASASDSIDAGLAVDATIEEAATAASVEDATLSAAVTTFSPSDKVNVTLSGGDLVATGTASGGARGNNSHSSSKYYWEYTFTTFNTNNVNLGIALASTNISTSSIVGAAVTTRLTGNILVNGSVSGSTLGALTAGNIIGIAADFTANLIWFRKAPAGSWNGSGTADPATGAGGISISSIAIGALFPFILTGVNDKITANFGASAFSGAVPSGFTSGF